ncbi:MAG: putative monovalent cation/H+ antiporter subunit A [Bacteroidia bacterium]|nr:putative monovalent cation/H+ antiporter subunit A [Bacteroidia bacterium]
MILSGILTVFLLAALAPLLHRVLRNKTGIVLAILPAGFSVWIVWAMVGGASDALPLESWEWVPSLGFVLSFRPDGLSLLFALLISGIGAIVLVYGGGYLKGHRDLGRFYAFLFLFMGSMLGVVLSDNLLVLFVFWELTGVASYLLIGYYHEKEESRKSALQALLITGAGGLTLLGGIILLSIAGGGFSITDLVSKAGDIRSHALYLPALLLILIGAFTKSAQVPFHFWLPGAMAAPAPVSAYLHSATMVKAGVFLLARLTPVLGYTAEWHYLVTLAGAATMIVGAVIAYTQTDLKRLLAFSTVSALGTLVMLLGIGTELAAKAAMVFLVVHSLYKGALFMVAGSIDHEAGTRDVRSLRGLIHVMPMTGIAAGLAALSMTGFPPLLGFISKELMYEAKMQAPDASLLILTLGVAANALTIAVALMVGIRPFLGKADQVPAGTHEGYPSLWAGPLFMGFAGLLFGLFPDLIAGPVLSPAVAAIRAEHVALELHLWHGINPVLLLSIATVILGVALYALREKSRLLAGTWAPPQRLRPGAVYQRAVAHLPALAARLAGTLQSGYLRTYLVIVLSAFIVLMGTALLRLHAWPVMDGFDDVTPFEWGLVLLMLAAILVVLFSRTRLAALAGLGIVGYGIAVIFIFYGAADLAITQILIETLTVIIFVLVVYHLPQFTHRSPNATRVRDGVIAVFSGGIVTALALLAADVQLFPSIAESFAQKSLTEGFGRNVVNVILVDFRALDTLGEITVLAVAAVGVFALIRLRPLKKEEGK